MSTPGFILRQVNHEARSAVAPGRRINLRLINNTLSEYGVRLRYLAQRDIISPGKEFIWKNRVICLTLDKSMTIGRSIQRMNEGIPDLSGNCRRPRQRWPAWLARTGGLHASTYLQALCVRLTAANSGAVAAEYAFLVAFISILAAAGMILLGDDLSVYFNNLGEALDNASTPTADPFMT